MEEKELQGTEQVVSGEKGADVSAYINTIKEMKKTYVPRQQLEEAEERERLLLDAVMNGAPAPEEEAATKVEPVDIDKLRNELYGPNARESSMTNLEFVTKQLQLRDALIERGDPDPYLPYGIDVTNDDIEGAQLVADLFKECIEASNGDDEVFTALLGSKITDVNLAAAKKFKR